MHADRRLVRQVALARLGAIAEQVPAQRVAAELARTAPTAPPPRSPAQVANLLGPAGVARAAGLPVRDVIRIVGPATCAVGGLVPMRPTRSSGCGCGGAPATMRGFEETDAWEPTDPWEGQQGPAPVPGDLSDWQSSVGHEVSDAWFGGDNGTPDHATASDAVTPSDWDSLEQSHDPSNPSDWIREIGEFFGGGSPPPQPAPGSGQPSTGGKKPMSRGVKAALVIGGLAAVAGVGAYLYDG